MKILFITSYSNPASGVSALYNLIEGLQGLEHECHFLTSNQHFLDIPSYTPYPPVLFGKKLNRLFNILFSEIQKKALPYYYRPFSHQYMDVVQKINPDIINIHWTHGQHFIPLNILPELSKRAKVVWTIHDMWPMTGGCFYSNGCSKFNKGCRRCPQRKSLGYSYGATTLLWYLKKRIYRNTKDLVLVSPSRWLNKLLKESDLFEKTSVVCIPNSVNTDVLSPIDKKIARDVLGISRKAKVIFLLATGDKRKGEYLFENVLEYYCSRLTGKMEPLTVLVGGNNALKWNIKKFPTEIQVVSVGTIQSQRILALCYSCADVFILPTKADNFPSSILESQACGTPVVSFRVGGVSEQIEEGRTGYLADSMDYKGLATGIHKVLELSSKKKTSSYCRKLIMERHALHIQAQHYEKLFELTKKNGSIC